MMLALVFLVGCEIRSESAKQVVEEQVEEYRLEVMEVQENGTGNFLVILKDKTTEREFIWVATSNGTAITPIKRGE